MEKQKKVKDDEKEDDKIKRRKYYSTEWRAVDSGREKKNRKEKEAKR
jgi:hypothetical protein